MQVTVGIELVPFQEPMNPKLVLPPACRPPFQDRFFAVTVDPLVVTVALQAWVMVCPLAYVQVTVQRADVTDRVQCQVRAKAISYDTVGQLPFTWEPTGSELQTAWVSVRTFKPAVTATLDYCKVA